MNICLHSFFIICLIYINWKCITKHYSKFPVLDFFPAEISRWLIKTRIYHGKSKTYTDYLLSEKNTVRSQVCRTDFLFYLKTVLYSMWLFDLAHYSYKILVSRLSSDFEHWLDGWEFDFEWHSQWNTFIVFSGLRNIVQSLWMI